VLAIGQALGGANASIVIATAGLAGGYVLPAEQAALPPSRSRFLFSAPRFARYQRKS
jgi:hypothetical protein